MKNCIHHGAVDIDDNGDDDDDGVDDEFGGIAHSKNHKTSSSVSCKKSSNLIGDPSKQATVCTNISTSLPATWGGGHANNNSLPDAMVLDVFLKNAKHFRLNCPLATILSRAIDFGSCKPLIKIETLLSTIFFQTPPAARCTLLMSMTCPFLSFIDQHVCANYVFSNTIGAAPGVILTMHDKTQSFLVCSAAPPVARCIVLMSMPIAHFSLSNTNTSVLKHLGMSNCAQH